MNDIEFRRCWNAGLDPDEAAKRLVARRLIGDPAQALALVSQRFAVFEKHLGIAPFPVHCLLADRNFDDATGIVPRRVSTEGMTPEYLAWKGITGAGAELRAIVAHQRAARRGVDEPSCDEVESPSIRR